MRWAEDGGEILLLTGPEDVEQPDKSLKAGADGYLTEPVDRTGLEARLGEAASVAGKPVLEEPERPDRLQREPVEDNGRRLVTRRRGRLRDVLLSQGKVTE